MHTSVSDAGHTDGARGSLGRSRVPDVGSQPAGRRQTERGLALQLAGGRVSPAWKGRAAVTARRRRRPPCRLEAGHGAATTTEAARQGL